MTCSSRESLSAFDIKILLYLLLSVVFSKFLLFCFVLFKIGLLREVRYYRQTNKYISIVDEQMFLCFFLVCNILICVQGDE